MKSEDEIVADFWTEKVNRLKNVLRYGAPLFETGMLHQALLQGGWEPEKIHKTFTRSFFGTECPSLQLSICQKNDIAIVQNPGIGTLDMNIQACREPVSLTGASTESVVNLIRTYSEHYPRYKEALDKLTASYRHAAKEEAKKQKIKKIALTNIHLALPSLFAGSDYHPYLKEGETEAVLAIRLQAGKTLEIKLPYSSFQNALPLIHATIARMEEAVRECPLKADLSETDYWHGEGFVPGGSPNK